MNDNLFISTSAWPRIAPQHIKIIKQKYHTQYKNKIFYIVRDGDSETENSYFIIYRENNSIRIDKIELKDFTETYYDYFKETDFEVTKHKISITESKTGISVFRILYYEFGKNSLSFYPSGMDMLRSLELDYKHCFGDRCHCTTTHQEILLFKIFLLTLNKDKFIFN